MTSDSRSTNTRTYLITIKHKNDTDENNISLDNEYYKENRTNAKSDFVHSVRETLHYGILIGNSKEIAHLEFLLSFMYQIPGFPMKMICSESGIILWGGKCTDTFCQHMLHLLLLSQLTCINRSY